ncbi:MAG: hypothetical protein FJ170_08485, partial [Gammaproteobacteria bacterium]|nr:hypothetical protein [Gammaproteobacteria bacterium]
MLANDGQDAVQSLSGVIDQVVGKVARGNDAERLTKHALRLEQEIRVLVAGGATGLLSTLWETASSRLRASAEEWLKDSLARLRAALAVEGEVIDCDGLAPARVLRHAWRTAQQAKAARSREEIERLALKLSDILKADFLRSDSGTSARALKASVGTVHDELFDFEAMSRLLATAMPKAALPASRTERLTALLSVLRSQRFFPAAAGASEGGNVPPHEFEFDNCRAALDAYRERLPEVRSLAKAIGVAKLEIDNEYVESRHDAFFEGFGEQGLDSAELALFPDYLVCVNARDLHGPEDDTLMAMLAAGMPVKVLAQTDDIFEPSPLSNGQLRIGSRSQQLASAAISLGGVYVLQTAASSLYQLR